MTYFILVSEKEARVDSVFLARGLADGNNHRKIYNASERMIYRIAIINPGQHYNTSTGEYTCPVTGIYLFTYSVYGSRIKDGYAHSTVSASLYREGTWIRLGYFSNENSEDISITLSHSDIVQCSEGDRVWVQSSHNNNQIYGHFVYNIFSGLLLYMT